MSLGRYLFSKPAKIAAIFSTGSLLVGLAFDGEYLRLFEAGAVGLIMFAGGVIAEWLRPTRHSAETK